jgi:outer membrane protein
MVVSRSATVGAALLGLLATQGRAADADIMSPEYVPQLRGSYVHVGAAGVFLDSGAEMRAASVPLLGATIDADPQPTFAVEVGHYITPDVAISATVGLPPTAKITGAGTLAGIGTLGKSTYGPSTLTIHYHFPWFGRFRPYIGFGPTFLVVFDSRDGIMSELRVKNSVGIAAQAGAEFMIDDHWGVFVDVKKAYLRTTATGYFGGALPIKADVKLDPLVLHSGLVYRF